MVWPSLLLSESRKLFCLPPLCVGLNLRNTVQFLLQKFADTPVIILLKCGGFVFVVWNVGVNSDNLGIVSDTDENRSPCRVRKRGHCLHDVVRLFLVI